MNILLTGSSGFIGGALKAHLRSNCIQVTDYDLPDCDILDPVHLRLKLKNVDMVVHMAAIADLYKTAKNLDKNFDVNIKGTHIVSRVCADEHIPMIFISTCCVYGNTDHDFETEDGTIPKTIEPYACSKVAGEYVVRGTNGLDYCILRIGTVFGENMREALFNYIALDKVLNEKEIEVFGDGLQTRNYIYIDDLIRGIHKAVELFDGLHGETINICSDEEISVIDTIRIAESVTRKRAIITYRQPRYGEIQSENISIEKAKKLLNWEPRYTYCEAIKKTFENDIRFK